MIFAILSALVFIQIFIIWALWYQKTYWKWADCKNCGRMIELHRERHVVYDQHPIWKGQCDTCYNHAVEFIV